LMFESIFTVLVENVEKENVERGKCRKKREKGKCRN